jgi:MYXO-CTERM domain-containing protein
MRAVVVVAVVLLTGAAVHAGPTQWAGNGHWYDVIFSRDMVTWDSANGAAQAGGGYLATLTSAGENDFVYALVDRGTHPELWGTYAWAPDVPAFGPWLGGYQDPYGWPADGNWRWVTGEAWAYTNWNPIQPDHWTGNGYREDRLMFWEGNFWNDLDRSGDPAETVMHGYVVEYDSNPSTATPELSTWMLLACSGLAGLGLWRRRKA